MHAFSLWPMLMFLIWPLLLGMAVCLAANTYIGLFWRKALFSPENIQTLKAGIALTLLAQAAWLAFLFITAK